MACRTTVRCDRVVGIRPEHVQTQQKMAPALGSISMGDRQYFEMACRYITVRVIRSEVVPHRRTAVIASAISWAERSSPRAERSSCATSRGKILKRHGALHPCCGAPVRRFVAIGQSRLYARVQCCSLPSSSEWLAAGSRSRPRWCRPRGTKQFATKNVKKLVKRQYGTQSSGRSE